MEYVIIGFFLIVMVGVLGLMIVSQWILFQKAGQPGWAALIPVYNTLVFLEVAKKPS